MNEDKRTKNCGFNRMKTMVILTLGLNPVQVPVGLLHVPVFQRTEGMRTRFDFPSFYGKIRGIE